KVRHFRAGVYQSRIAVGTLGADSGLERKAASHRSSNTNVFVADGAMLPVTLSRRIDFVRRILGASGQEHPQVIAKVLGSRVPLGHMPSKSLEADALQLFGDSVIHLAGRPGVQLGDLL